MGKYLLLFHGQYVGPYNGLANSCTRIIEVASDDKLPEEIKRALVEVEDIEQFKKTYKGFHVGIGARMYYVLHQILKL